jgi:hypothetical protein
LNLFKTVHVVYIEEKKLVMFAASLELLQITKLLVDEEEEEVERQEAHRFTFKKGEKGRKEP